MSKIFYPSCKWLDPNTASTVYKHHRGHRIFQDDRCAPNCWHRDGKTRVPTL